MLNLNEKMVTLGTQRSVIRELFEFGKIKAAEIGAENVFDFSIGNPSVPAPESVSQTNRSGSSSWIYKRAGRCRRTCGDCGICQPSFPYCLYSRQFLYVHRSCGCFMLLFSWSLQSGR